jgi:DNA modification methylase
MPGLPPLDIPGQTVALGLEPDPWAYVGHLVEVFRAVRRVLRDDGTLWLNLGDSYAGGGYSNHQNTGGAQRANGGKQKHTPTGDLKPKDLCGIPWRVAYALQADGWYLRSDIIWHKPNPMPESVTDRPTKAHEYLFLLSKRPRYFYDADAIREEEDGPNRRSVWTMSTRPYAAAHFATFPPELPERCIKAGTRPGDLVLDPFSGAGTTGMVARRLQRAYIGAEQSEEYAEMSRRRIDGDAPLFNRGTP